MKRILLPFLFLLFNITLCYSQYIDETNEKQIDSFESLLSSQTDSEKLFTHLKLISLHMLSSSETTKKYIDSLNENAIKLKNEEYIGHSIRGLGQYYYQISRFNDAVKTYKRAITKFDSLQNKEELSKVYNLLAITQSVKGDLDSAAESSLRSIRIAEEIGITGRKLAGPYFNLGTLFARLKNYEKAIGYFNKAGKIAEEINWEPGIARVKVNLGNVYRIQQKLNEALLNYKKAEVFFRKVNDFKNLGSTLNNIGNVYEKMNDYRKARQYYNKALKFENKLQPQLVGLLNRNIGILYAKEDNFAEALKYYKISKSCNEITGNNDRLLDDFDYIGEAYANLGQYRKAYENQLVFNRMYDSIYNLKRVAAIEELETKYETEKKQTAIILQEEEIKTLNAQAKNDRLTKTLYGIGMFSFLTIAGLLYFGFKQRIKKNKIEREKQEEIYKQEIAFKKKELASQTLHLVQKSTFIQELKENLEKIKKSPELFKVEFRRIVMLLKKQNAEDKDWEVFKSYFSEVHNNFDHKIKAISEDVTEKEIRLASFLRMNLSTKEIASMLNVLPDSVLKSKYRLKKKLQLDKEYDLTEFLNTL